VPDGFIILSRERTRRRAGSASAPLARVDRGEAQINGPLNRGQIDRAVARHGRGLRYCYERELRRHENLHGSVIIRWVIDIEGRVTGRYVDDNTMRNRNVESCLLREVGRMRFPPPETAEVEVTYPFNFSPDDGEGIAVEPTE
jgi:hypothetical protein